MANEIDKSRELQEFARLEKKHDIGQILRTNPQIALVDGTMIRWLSLIMQNTDIDSIIEKWRGLAQRGGRTAADFSSTQKKVLSLPDEEIINLYDRTQVYLKSSARDVPEWVANKVNVVHAWNDRYETRQKPKRDLGLFRHSGVIITIDPKDFAQVRSHYTEDGELPLLDNLKNDRIASINGFDGSKTSLTIHDTFDHFWLYDKLDSLGILQRYQSFLQSVGSPQTTDMFSREGELIASVGFEWRSSHLPERAFKPIFSLDQIKGIFNKTKVLSENQQRALDILLPLDAASSEAKKLCSIYSGVLVELMEQRRKNGYIRLLDENFEPKGVLPLLDPEYLALIIESNHILCAPEVHAKDLLFKIEAIVEDHLIGLARGEVLNDLTLTLPGIEAFNPAKSRLSPKRRAWLRKNPFHAATRVLETGDGDLQPAADEYLDLVDKDDQVIGSALRSNVYKERLSNFRTVNGFIVNSQGQLWIPRRQSDKRVAPNALDFSIGEHLESGESYDTAFRRGAREELRINVDDTEYALLGKLTPDNGVSSYMRVYEISLDNAPDYSENDFSGGAWTFPDELRALIENGSHAKSDLIIVLNHYYPPKI